ncbi:MAG: hypothetical protein KGI43_06980 [Alphaproteobacteria bacterium]|nr:hypothetical protein [Alphaproteobacteria bacterium]
MTPLFGNLASAPSLLLIAAVIVVGVLHTAVPDHWVPITLLARQHGWSRTETAWAAARAGIGHTVSTLAIGIVVWLVGVSAAQRFGGAIDTLTSLALVLFGGWCVVMGLRELQGEHGHHHGHGHDHDHDHGHDHEHGHGGHHPHRHAEEIRHVHLHRHEGRTPHIHMHAHAFATAHPITAAIASDPPLHDHGHKATGRGALLIILGSSPMIEGIPAFFAASRLGVGQIVLMAILFAASTMATYVVLCVTSVAGLERASLGPLERYGEILSGGFIAVIGVIFWFWPVL